MSVKASASAKTILFGEHAVVYNEPAIAIPLSQTRTYAELTPNRNKFRVISSKTHLNKTYEELNPDSGLRVLLDKIIDTLHLSKLPDDTLIIKSSIPIASGLGSGAALSIAVIRAFAERFGQDMSPETVNSLAYEAEKVYHGTPSGIDNTTIAYEKPIIFSKTTGFETLKADIGKFHLLVIDSGIRSRTIDVVSDVRANFSHNEPFIREIGELVRSSAEVLEQGDETELGRLMNENQRLLQKIDVSCPEMDELIAFGLSHGAPGGKITGAGRGGNFLMLAKDAGQAEHLKFLYEKRGLQVIL